FDNGARCLGHVAFAPMGTRCAIADAYLWAFNARVDHANDFIRFFEHDHVRKTRSMFPRRKTASNKFICLIYSLMWTPSQITCHFFILSPASKDDMCIIHARFPQNKSFGFDPLR